MDARSDHVFDSSSSENAVGVLDEALRKYGRPTSVLTDRGSSSYAVEAEGTNRILCKESSGETNGKLEKLFDTIEKGLAKGISPIDECVGWYNTIEPHGALDLKNAETPIEAYHRNIETREELMGPSILTKGRGK